MIEEGSSTLTFEIDPELKITVSSKINPDIVETLIDKGYIKSEFSEDEPTIQFAFILIANEATEQIIENVNNHEET
jgi:ribosomal protein S8